jgi:hypothetical protein
MLTQLLLICSVRSLISCSLKAYRAKCIKEINAYGEMHCFFPAMASTTGGSVTEIPVSHYPRKYGGLLYPQKPHRQYA